MAMIWVRGIKCKAKVGVPDWERKKPQTIVVDVGLEVDIKKAAASDDVRETVDYWSLEKAVRARAAKGEYRLLERLAWELCDLARRFDRRVKSASVHAKKKPAVMPLCDEVAVELTLLSAGRRRE